MKKSLFPLLFSLSISCVAVADSPAISSTAVKNIDVYKSERCGCCNDWIDYMEKNGFKVTAHNTGNSALHKKFGVKDEYVSCHTAVIDGYVVEGHVPVEDVNRLLREKPNAIGISAPGMPVGSPGMDGEVYQGRKDPHDILLLNKDGSSEVFNSYNQ